MGHRSLGRRSISSPESPPIVSEAWRLSFHQWRTRCFPGRQISRRNHLIKMHATSRSMRTNTLLPLPDASRIVHHRARHRRRSCRLRALPSLHGCRCCADAAALPSPELLSGTRCTDLTATAHSSCIVERTTPRHSQPQLTSFHAQLNALGTYPHVSQLEVPCCPEALSRRYRFGRVALESVHILNSAFIKTQIRPSARDVFVVFRLCHTHSTHHWFTTVTSIIIPPLVDVL